ncbi:hypothetical protein [Kordia sp.]|uniref:hypothetical protein n=1 Tax=Kordia sp. TaxID=1965332 RepID=UPI003D6C5CFB
MLKNLLNVAGVQQLSKSEQNAVNGGKKCEYLHEPMSPFEQEAGLSLCMVRCRPSFLGIGTGSWSDWEHNVPCP